MNLNTVSSPAHAVASKQAILFHNTVEEPIQLKRRVDCSGVKFPCQSFAFNDFSATARAPDSHLTKLHANSGKFFNHGIKPSGQQ